MHSITKLALFLAAAVPALAQTDCTNGAVVVGTNCVQECDTTRPGSDIPGAQLRINGPTALADCAAACFEDQQCVTAQYRNDNRVCYLKSRVNNANPSEIVDSVLCRVTPGCVPGRQVAGTSCVEECSTTRVGSNIPGPGTEIRLVGDDALQQCARACEANAQCTTAQYRLDNKTCYLKRRTNRAVQDANVNGIVCRENHEDEVTFEEAF